MHATGRMYAGVLNQRNNPMGKQVNGKSGKDKGQNGKQLILNSQQWKKLRESATPVESLPHHGVYFMFVPTPDGGVLGTAFCREDGPDTICMVVPRPHPGGGNSYECRCRPRHDPDIKTHVPSLRSEKCQTIAFGNRLKCVGVECDGRCELQAVERKVIGHSITFLFCKCVHS